jgi:hypothetical protein
LLKYANDVTYLLGTNEHTLELKEVDLSKGVTAIKINTKDGDKKGRTICYYDSSSTSPTSFQRFYTPYPIDSTKREISDDMEIVGVELYLNRERAVLWVDFILLPKDSRFD